ncbi:MAG TPA: FliA/WhiG family RNA polymerase sigma factor [Thermodesulfobacteriota bacterium]|nr:FliA/WhiG family RNA polymerase sigma factor [Thermodesulfobacteriota bacterium]
MYGYNVKISSQEREDIIKEFLPMVRYTAYRLSWRLPPQISVDDLISVGLNGLIEALDRFEKGKVKLKTYAQYRIKGAMLDELRAVEWIPRSRKKKINSLREVHQKLEKELKRMPEDEEVAAALNISLDEYYQILDESKVGTTFKFEDFETMSEKQDINLMDNIEDPNGKNPLNLLVEMDQKKMMARVIDELPEKEKTVLSLYYWEELTMKEVGAVLGLTESRVCQLHNQALLRLKSKLSKELS